MVKAAYKGYGARMLGVGPTGLPNYIPASHLYTYDPAKAAALLKQAGYANGFNVNITWQTGDNQGALMAQIFKADLAPLHITTTLQVLSNAVYYPDSQKESTNPDIFIGMWTMDYADDQQMYINYFWSKSPPASGNVFYFKNPALDKVLTQAMQATSPASAKALYTKVLDIVYNEAYEIWAAQPDERIALSDHIHGYQYNFLYSEYYFDLYALSKS
jgi:ABC-type transport system substrate-binding protein